MDNKLEGIFQKKNFQKEISLYLHIPFCKQKCRYCDFLSFAGKENMIKSYVDALIFEISYSSKKIADYKVKTVFVGGGTPSLLEISDMKRIFESLQNSFDLSECKEVTIESNPGTLSLDKINGYREIGINRISMGLQSANDEELRLLGRIHDYKLFEDNFYKLREAGFNNINIDLINGLPGQNNDKWLTTLQKVIGLNPEHISAYSLIIEDGTPFYEIYGPGKKMENSLPDENEERKMYYETRNILTCSGYHQYEISNFALDGKECAHNKVYWKRGNYLGLGLGASSLINENRFKNTSLFTEYLEVFGNKDIGNIDSDFESKYRSSLEEYEVLDEKNAMEEFMILGLRMSEGISFSEFENNFGKDFYSVKEYLEHTNKMVDENLLKVSGDRLFLTNRGMDLANYVMQGYC